MSDVTHTRRNSGGTRQWAQRYTPAPSQQSREYGGSPSTPSLMEGSLGSESGADGTEKARAQLPQLTIAGEAAPPSPRGPRRSRASQKWIFPAAAQRPAPVTDAPSTATHWRATGTSPSETLPSLSRTEAPAAVGPVADGVDEAASLAELFSARCAELGVARPNATVLRQLPGGTATGRVFEDGVEYLDLSETYLGPRACTALAAVLPRCRQLRGLRLTAVGLEGHAHGPHGQSARHVFESLRACRHLFSLDVAGNAIDDVGGRWLLALLRASPSITELNVAGTRLSESMRGKIEAHMANVGGRCVFVSRKDKGVRTARTAEDERAHDGPAPPEVPAAQRNPRANPAHLEPQSVGAVQREGLLNTESAHDGLSDGEDSTTSLSSTRPVRRRLVPPSVAAALVELRLRLIRNRERMQRVYDCFMLPESVEKRVSMGSTAMPSHAGLGDRLTREQARSLLHLELLGAPLDETTLRCTEQGTCSWKAFFRGLRVLGIHSASRTLSQSIAFASACGVLCAETAQFGKLLNMLRVHVGLVPFDAASTAPHTVPDEALEDGHAVLAAYTRGTGTEALYDTSPLYTRAGASLTEAEPECLALGSGETLPSPTAEQVIDRYEATTRTMVRESREPGLDTATPTPAPTAATAMSFPAASPLADASASRRHTRSADGPEHNSSSRPWSSPRSTLTAPFHGLTGWGKDGWGSGILPSVLHRRTLTGGYAAPTAFGPPACFPTALPGDMPGAEPMPCGGTPTATLAGARGSRGGAGSIVAASSSSPPSGGGRVWGSVLCAGEGPLQQPRPSRRSVTWRAGEIRDLLASDGLSGAVSAGEVQFVMDRLYDARDALRRGLRAVAEGGAGSPHSLPRSRDGDPDSLYVVATQPRRSLRVGSVCHWPVVQAQPREDGGQRAKALSMAGTDARASVALSDMDEVRCSLTSSLLLPPKASGRPSGAASSRGHSPRPSRLVPFPVLFDMCAAVVGAGRLGVLQCVLSRCGLNGDTPLVDYENDLLARLRLRSGEAYASALPPVSLALDASLGREGETGALPAAMRARHTLLQTAEGRALAPEEAVELWRALTVTELQKTVEPY